MNVFPEQQHECWSPRVREHCGLCAVIGDVPVLQYTHLGLHAQQHRGQEAAGVMVNLHGDCRVHKRAGLVDEVFKTVPKEWWRPGEVRRAIGHVRYSTAGGSREDNAQPLMVRMNGANVGIAHNGTLCNARSLRRRLQEEGAIFQTTTDTEIILHLMARHLMKDCHGDIWQALEAALEHVRGAFCLLLMTADFVVAVRDPFGFRPLSIGRFENGGYMVASETIAFQVTGAEYLREVEPGEMVVFGPNDTMVSHRFAPVRRRAHCIFEHVYFARPGSYVFGDSVYEVRKEMGRRLAREAPVDADVIIPVPDSGMFAALGYAEESGIPLDMGLTRNHYVGRTFIDPGITPRPELVMRKLQPIVEALEGKRICLIEDSIVRGSTSRARIRTLRAIGVKEIHMRVSCPPHRYGCYFGIDFPSREELLANKVVSRMSRGAGFAEVRTEAERRALIDELRKDLGLDTLAYLSQEGMLACVKAYTPGDYCCACFDGDYPTPPELIEEPDLPHLRSEP